MKGEAQLLTVVSTSTTAGTCGQANGSISVTVTGGTLPYQYSDDGGATWQGSATFNNLAGGLYTIQVQDATVPVPQNTNVGVALGNLAGPSGLAYTAVAASCLNNDGALQILPQGGTSPYTYTINGGTPQSGNLFGGLPSGNAFISVVDANGCQAGQIVNIPLTPNENLSVSGGGTVCEGQGVPLIATSNASAFSWTPAAGLSNPNVANPVASPNATTTYTLTATLGVCSMTGPPVTVNILPAPTPAATPPTAQLCPGQSVQLQGSGGVTYAWSPATYLSSTTVANPTVQMPAKSITYSLNVTGPNGCSSVQPALVLVIVSPPPEVFAGNDTAIYLGQTLPLDAVDVNNVGFSTYQWSPAFGLDNPSIRDPVATITGDITYAVTATTPTGCTGTDSIKIIAVTKADLVVPNAFTPNGDGHNDVLYVHAIGMKEVTSFRVFNRWGQQVFETTNQGEGWNGMLGGQAQPPGTYVWVAGGEDFLGKTVERRGTVILVR
ncbi:MAG TPA: gliding motility-associated C-terminal domain-containing protein [Puia sp.]|nr:gliding motility-associated C-terminal domain-containing protein [Puia sp.]